MPNCSHYSLRARIYEMCIVKVNIGRAAGHSSYIQSRATKNDLVVVRHAHKFKGVFPPCNSPRIFHYSSDTSSLIGLRFDKIYVDDCDHFMEDLPFSTFVKGLNLTGDETFVVF
jgi:hypothetical protein